MAKWVASDFECVCEAKTTMKYRKPSLLTPSIMQVICLKCNSAFSVKISLDKSGPNKCKVERRLKKASKELMQIVNQFYEDRNKPKTTELFSGKVLKG